MSHSLSATTAKDRPPKQYGAYQSLEPFPRTRPNRGIEFANDSVVEPDLTNPEPLFGHTIRTESARDAIQQTQYPLDEESPATIQTNIIEQPRTLPWVAPLLAVPGSLTAPLESNWLHMSGVNVDATHVVGTGNYLGITTLSAGVVLETPSFQPFSIRPNIGWHTLHGPRRTDLPSQLYDVSIEMRMYWPFGDRWLGEFAIAPGLYTDFQNTNSDALRIVGRAVGYYRWSPDLQLAVGAAYLDRQDVVAVPVAGLVWTPTPDDRFEILVPRPRFAHRFRKCDNHERWAYIAGEFGGGSWAIERTTGADDIATYRDFRLITGIEFKFDDKSSWRVEGGYVFGRELEYDSNLGNYQPGDTALVRAALRF
ncbi:MAG: hypothetical protein KDA93_15495 [Planctomycetaceae bacterium]|nr:hypothetical protein [Planctomycetaceae bacterium]